MRPVPTLVYTPEGLHLELGADRVTAHHGLEVYRSHGRACNPLPIAWRQFGDAPGVLRGTGEEMPGELRLAVAIIDDTLELRLELQITERWRPLRMGVVLCLRSGYREWGALRRHCISNLHGQEVVIEGGALGRSPVRRIVGEGRFDRVFFGEREARLDLELALAGFTQWVRIEDGRRWEGGCHIVVSRFGTHKEELLPGTYGMGTFRFAARPFHEARAAALGRPRRPLAALRRTGFRVAKALTLPGYTTLMAAVTAGVFLARDRRFAHRRPHGPARTTDRHTFGPPRPDAPLVSVGIPTYNRSTSLQLTLESLMYQTLAPERYEIIVVNDGGNDDAAARLAALQPRVHIRYLCQTNAGPAAARNAVWREARAPIIAYLDDDCRADRRWLEHIAARYGESDLAGRAGRVLAVPSQSMAARFLAFLHLHEHAFRDSDNAVIYPITCNASFSRDHLAAVGGFDERFPFPGGEDEDLGLVLRHHGYYFEEALEAVVHHDHKASLEEILRVWYRYGVGAQLIWEKHDRRFSLARTLLRQWGSSYFVGRAAVQQLARGELTGTELVSFLAFDYLKEAAYLVGILSTRVSARRDM